MRRLTLGDSATAGMFEDGLRSFRETLIPYYREKTKLVSLRENLRFQYLSAYKTKISNIAGQLFQRAQSTNDGDLMAAVGIIVGAVLNGIPMATLSGGELTEGGFAQRPLNFGGRIQINLFSPTNHYLTEAYNDVGNPDQRPVYQLINYRDYNRFSADELWSVVWPVTQEWFEEKVDRRYQGNQGVKNQFARAMELVTEPTSFGDLIPTMQKMREIFGQIVELTYSIIILQMSIDEVESSLSAYVDQYREFSGGEYNLPDILLQLHNEAEKAGTVQATEIPVGATVVTEASQLADASSENTVPAIEEVKPKSKTMLYAATAAIALLLFKKS